MIKIVVKASNLDRISSILQDAQEGARARIITAHDIIYDSKRLESILTQSPYGNGVPKTALKGTSVVVNMHAQLFAGAYRGIPMSTKYELVFSTSGWVLTNVYRGVCDNLRYDFHFSDAAKDSILRNYFRG